MGDGIILQSGPALGLGNQTFANASSYAHALLPLDVDPMTQIGVSIVCIRMWFAYHTLPTSVSLSISTRF